MNIELARKKLFEKDETNGYCEREQAIDEFLGQENLPQEQGERYVAALEYVLPRLSPLIEAEDVIVGRMVEGPVPYELEGVPGNGFSHVGNPFRPQGTREAGHMNLDYGKLVNLGLSGILAEMDKNAETEAQKKYAALSRRAAEAVHGYQLRYAEAAKEAGNLRAYEALQHVPYEPAYDFFSALQGIWIYEIILSCVTGGRDFAYGRLDKVLFPFYREEERDDVRVILQSYFLKNNEIGGFSSDINVRMPVPCCSTNIYVMLGGVGAEKELPLSLLFLEAAEDVHLPQPILAVRLSEKSDPQWLTACMHAAQTLSGQVSFYNDDAIIDNVRKLGFTEEHALNYTMSGCNRVDFPGHQSSDKFHNLPQLLLNALYDPAVTTMDGLLARFEQELDAEYERTPGHYCWDPAEEMHFFLESLLLEGCMEKVCDVENGGAVQESVVHHQVGIATLGNSLAAIDRLVFTEHRLTLDEYRELLKSNYENDPAMRMYILNRVPKYGNDDEFADGWTRKGLMMSADAIDRMSAKSGRIHILGLYSLFYHHFAGTNTGATPDGRLAGEPLSESQSPTYGTDREGLVPLLHSVSRLPQERAGCGGLNVRLEKKLPDELLLAVTEAFFQMGAVNLCPDVMSRETLIEAVKHPEQYQTLCVRIVGFSEVFVRLPEYMQQELINRTSSVMEGVS